ncbi:hypothetical protein NM688_g9359 [Phlebia brevispora]|uniref:Uncharacterized protein n=1 Tax=Phlebia brevispora TaxID=194682 RepID=A0ACC1RIG6_9APHY|nr:hypothetical protein NM688_g9359 [Phlebia brevispora]
MLCSTIKQRIPNNCGKFKTDSSVPIERDFKLGRPGTTKRVSKLLKKKTYIYPGDVLKDTVSYDEPYRRPIIAELLQLLCHRVGSHNVSGFYIKDDEGKYIKDSDGTFVRVIPKPMLAYVATVIEPQILAKIEEEKPTAYRTLMRDLYDDALGTERLVDASDDADEALEALQLDNLKEDYIPHTLDLEHFCASDHSSILTVCCFPDAPPKKAPSKKTTSARAKTSAAPQPAKNTRSHSKAKVALDAVEDGPELDAEPKIQGRRTRAATGRATAK